MPIRYTYAYRLHAYEMHAYKIYLHACEVYAFEMHAYYLRTDDILANFVYLCLGALTIRSLYLSIRLCPSVSRSVKLWL